LLGQAVGPQSLLSELNVTIKILVGQAVESQMAQITVPIPPGHRLTATETDVRRGLVFHRLSAQGRANFASQGKSFVTGHRAYLLNFHCPNPSFFDLLINVGLKAKQRWSDCSTAVQNDFITVIQLFGGISNLARFSQTNVNVKEQGVLLLSQ
jgi:hypothetical protein